MAKNKTITLTEEEFLEKTAETFSDLSKAEQVIMDLAFGKLSNLEMAFKTGAIVTILSERLFDDKGEE